MESVYLLFAKVKNSEREPHSEAKYRSVAASPSHSPSNVSAVQMDELPTETGDQGVLWQNLLCAGSPVRPRAKTMNVFIDEPYCYSRLHQRPFTQQILWTASQPTLQPRKTLGAFLSADSKCFPETKVLREASCFSHIRLNQDEVGVFFIYFFFYTNQRKISMSDHQQHPVL